VIARDVDARELTTAAWRLLLAVAKEVGGLPAAFEMLVIDHTGIVVVKNLVTLSEELFEHGNLACEPQIERLRKVCKANFVS